MAPAKEGTFSVTKELRRNRGLVATIVALTTLILTLEVIAHAGFTRSVWHTRDMETQQTRKSAAYNDPSPSQCGSTAEEARRLGCIFDELSFAWQAPDCYDEATVGEFLAAGNWKFYPDETSTETLPLSQLGLDRQPTHVTLQFQAAQCMFLRRQMVRLLLLGRPMDTHLGAYNHTLNCGKLLLNTPGMDEDKHTRVPIIYPACKLLQGKKS